MMNLLRKFNDLFIAVPVEQLATMAGEEAQIELAQRDYTIRKEQFARHLALAKLEAVRTWEQPKENVK